MSEPDFGLRFTLATLATWRVAHLLAFEDGPWALVARLRAAAGRLGGVLECFYCLSLWVAAPLALWVTASAIAWPCVVLALSGGACLLHRLTLTPVVMQPLAQGDGHGMLRTEPADTSELDAARTVPGGAAASPATDDSVAAG
jgi:hypothetical protein